MAITYGLTVTGFVPKTLEIIREEIKARVREKFGASVDMGDESLLGHLIGIMAERLADLWELAEAVNSSTDPDKATDDALAAILALTGTLWPEARTSRVTLTLTGTTATVVGSGSRAATSSTAMEWVTSASATLAAVTAWAGSTAYTAGTRRTNASRVYLCITAGTSAGSGGPTTTAADITDGTAHWRYLGEGNAAADVAAASADTGPIIGTSGDIKVIMTPVGGWQSVVNILDADLGRDEAANAEARLLRESELALSGAATLDAIRADLLEVDDVTSCTVFSNDTDVTNGDGMPPHSVEAVVRGGTDQDIIDALFNVVGAGIPTHGTTTGSHVDSEGTTHVVKFTRPTEVPIWIIYNVDVEAEAFPSDGADQIKAAAVKFGDAQKTGKNSVASSTAAQAFKVAGVFDSAALIGLSNPPVATTTIAISSRQLATIDTSRITVNATPGTP